MSMKGYVEVRYPAVAGTFYPSDPFELRRMLKRYLDAAPLYSLQGIRALIAPHAGYIYSGPIAAYSYKQLQNLSPAKRTIFLIGPAHYVYVRGVAVGTYHRLLTPLGEVPVDAEKADALLGIGEPFVPALGAHEPEHSLEVQLPFLQMTVPGEFSVVPMLAGDANPTEIAEGLESVLGPDDLIVVSSDLSHYHRYDVARSRDTDFLQSVVKYQFDSAVKGEACGIIPILALMQIGKIHGWKPHLLDYRNSGDTAGDHSRVVGYAAVVYTEANNGE